MLTRNGVCEQAEHVKSPQEMEYDVAMKTRTNLCRNICALNGVSIRKNVSCGSVYNTETEKCTTLIEMYYSHSFQLYIFGSLLCSFSVFIRNAHCTSIRACVRLSCGLNVRTDHRTLSCLLLCCIFEGSKKLRIYMLTKDESCDMRYITSVLRCIGQKLYFFLVMIPIKTIVIERDRRVRPQRNTLSVKYERVISSGISHIACES